MAAYWEIAAHSAFDVFSKYKYLIANLVFPTSDFSEIAAVQLWSNRAREPWTITRAEVRSMT